MSCHLCGSPSLREVPGYPELARVTSDCQPWSAGGCLVVCEQCGGVQHPLDDAWHDEARRIYADYDIYHQSGGVEQSVFGSGAAESRSSRLMTQLGAELKLPAGGRLLDVGCGNGATLSAFGKLHPQWKLVGTELSDRHKANIEKLPGVELMHAGDPGDAPGRFDLITLVHVLEHIPAPADFLATLRGKLAPGPAPAPGPGGRLFIQTPDHDSNPFDLLIADHCSHFTAGTLASLVGRCGFEVSYAGNWIAKELSLVARVGASTAVPASASAFDHAAQRVNWLRSLPRWAAGFTGRMGLFGTSIAATWMLGELGDRVAFFVDEDPARAGRTYRDRPVHRPENIPDGSDVLVLLPVALAERVAERLAQPGVRYHVPPA